MVDPTVHGARLVPEVDEASGPGIYIGPGVEPGGGVRRIVHGMRLVNLASGAVLSAPDRLPGSPAAIVAVPERLGGGFLFQLGTTLWYAERWLAPAKPVFQSSTAIGRTVIGLDRVYVRAQSGAHQAFDPTNGARLDLGPWPEAPSVTSYVAADGWRAAAVADWRGVLATFDAGATWKAIPLPMAAREVSLLGDAIVAQGVDAGGQAAWYEIQGDGQVTKLSGAPRAAALAHVVEAGPADGVARRFGRKPLLAAIEDGWPLSDGTAVVARDGALARIRLSDGAIVESAADAYELRASRCHPVSLARKEGDARFGFVCGEVRGTTILYAYDPESGRMNELRRWEQPRAIISSGNGALAVRGGCGASDGSEDRDRTQQSYCLLPRDGHWREIRVRGDVGGERVVVLSDGRVAVLSPPNGSLGSLRVTVLDKGSAKTVPVSFPALPQDVARVLKNGVWLEGFEERKPGVLGGWVEAAGSMIGVEVTLDGHAKHGRFIRDAGNPMVSGRYGLGFTGARRGYETTDGGMTWADVDLPDPALTNPRAVKERACGPVGCTAAGWLRVGWGAAPAATHLEAPPVPRHTANYANTLDLVCEPTAGTPPEAPKPPPRAHVAEEQPQVAYGHYGRYYPGGYYPGYQARGLSELPAFFTAGAPILKPEELGVNMDVPERTGYGRSVARIYAWGPKAGDWDRAGRWVARWVWPFGGWPDVRSSQLSTAPFASLDGAMRGLGVGQNGQGFAVAGDDARHLLALAKHYVQPTGWETTMLALESDRPPLEVRRSDGEPFSDVIAATRAGGHWYALTGPSAGEVAAAVIWVVDGSSARELARVPRAGDGYAQPPTARLARRSDGRAIGLVIDGQPANERGPAQRWVLPIDLESGGAGEPEPIGAADFSDRPLAPCEEGAPGWIYDTTLQTAVLHFGTEARTVSTPIVRVHATTSRACLAMMGASVDAQAAYYDYGYYGAPTPAAPAPAAWLVHQGAGAQLKADRPSFTAGIFHEQRQYPVRCAAH